MIGVAARLIDLPSRTAVSGELDTENVRNTALREAQVKGAPTLTFFEKIDSLIDAGAVEHGPRQHHAWKAYRRAIARTDVVHSLNESRLGDCEGMPGDRARVSECRKGLSAFRANDGNGAPVFQAGIAVFIVCKNRWLTGDLHGCAAVRRHSPDITAAIPSENVFEGQFEAVRQASDLLPVPRKSYRNQLSSSCENWMIVECRDASPCMSSYEMFPDDICPELPQLKADFVWRSGNVDDRQPRADVS
jgi:hypothetical protein